MKINNKNKWLILVVLVTQPFMACLDSSIVNVALPTISSKLNIEMSSAEWIVSAYLIIISAAILIFGRLGDIKSKSLIFNNGILGFIFGSLLCALSPNIEILVLARIVQAIGAAMIMSTNQGIITDVFPSDERGRALGISGSFVALGSLLGPALGGFIVTYLSWHFIFLINIPIGIIAYYLGKKYLPIENKTIGEAFDSKGATLFALTTLLIFTSIMLGQNLGFTNIYIVLGFIVGIILFILFILVEKKVVSPMLHLKLFKKRTFSLNLFCAFISFAAINTINVIQPFYLSDVLNYSAEQISIVMLFYPLVLFIIAPLSGSLSDKIGSKKLTLAGLFLTAISMYLLSTTDSHTSRTTLILMLSLLGFSNGLFQSPNTNLIMSSVPKDKLGIAGGSNALIRNLGLAFGVSASTSFLYYKMSEAAGYKVLGTVQGKPEIFVYGMKYLYIIVSITCIIAFTLSLIDYLTSNDY
ncbi:MAG: MFS transporter [Clostridium sp.]|uniref:MFS transporter n=1 Tax=Clostridium sp. TaxID=1506 RepID=UPI003F40773A